MTAVTFPHVPLLDGAIDRRIVALAIPALGALAVEPLYVLVDTAIVGRLGTIPLAGLALASSVLLLVVAGPVPASTYSTNRTRPIRHQVRNDLRCRWDRRGHHEQCAVPGPV